MKISPRLLIAALGIFLVVSSSVLAVGIDPLLNYAWGENIGWMNWGTPEGAVDVPEVAGDLSGYVWGENVGWISLNCLNTASCGTVDYKVSLSGGLLSGYAWGENIGWISFSCSNTGTCGTVDYGASIATSSGEFSGYAWGENTGWVVFNCATTASCGTVDYKVARAESSTPTPDPGGGGGGPGPSPTPGLSDTPFPTISISATPTPLEESATPEPSASSEPSGSPEPTPQITPQPGQTPVSSPPQESPPSSAPSSGPGGSGIFAETSVVAEEVAQALDEAIAQPLLDLLGPIPEDLCRGAVGIAACGVTSAGVAVVAIGVAAAVVQSEAVAAGYWFLHIIGIVSKPPAWGTVYDSRTRRPIPAVKLELVDSGGRVVETRFTDRDGRYGFLTTPSSRNSSEMKVIIRASKPGYAFPSVLNDQKTNYVVYENPYQGGEVTLMKEGVLNFSIPLDAVSPERVRWSGFGSALFSRFTDRILAAGFLLGLVAVPLNYYFFPTTKNLVILSAFVLVNGIRLAVIYRPYGITVNAVTGKPLPYALVVLLDDQGRRVGFAVSDEYGRYVLSGDRQHIAFIEAYSPANISPQRSAKYPIPRFSTESRTAWLTQKIRI
jgi:hypothetical protein